MKYSSSIINHDLRYLKPWYKPNGDIAHFSSSNKISIPLYNIVNYYCIVESGPSLNLNIIFFGVFLAKIIRCNTFRILKQKSIRADDNRLQPTRSRQLHCIG